MEADAVSRLYAVLEAGESARERLEVALAAAEIACVLFEPRPHGALGAGQIEPLVATAQARGVAALIAGDAELARALRADGVHIASDRGLADAYTRARALLGQHAIVGIDAGISRHDAMTLAEAGADYIAFGAPSRLKDRDKARARRDELITWWAEIFEVPCVALDVETPGEAEALARTGADFIGIRLAAGANSAAVRDLVSDIAAAAAVPATAD